MALKEARQLLTTQIDAAVSDTDVDVVAFDGPDVVAPVITVATAGVTPTDWLLIIRVYVDAGQSEQAQDFLDDLLESVDVLLANAAIPRSTWDREFDDLRGMFFMFTTVSSPREDM